VVVGFAVQIDVALAMAVVLAENVSIVTKPVAVVQNVVEKYGIGSRPTRPPRYTSVHPDGHGIRKPSPVCIVDGLNFVAAPAERIQIGRCDFIVASIKMMQKKNLCSWHAIR
jgi:hypothetical protein